MGATVLDPAELARRHSDREARRSRASHAAAAEIGPLPPVANPERRESCRRDLHRFLTTYFPHSTGLAPFGDKQVEAIRRIQACVLEGGRFLNCLPRGFVKSTTSENSTIWATAYGHRRYAVFFGAGREEADEALESIKREWQTNERLAEDFPEVAAAIEALDGKSQRCASQTYGGDLTFVEWTADTIVLPTIRVPRGWGVPGAELDPNDLVPSDASGAIIRAKGLLAASRGMRFKRPDGTQARPDLVFIDDPQTDESAASPTQCAKRLSTIRKSILRLGGHGRAVAAVANATVIQEGDLVDQLADPKRHPEWQAIRVAMMPKLPDRLDDLWLGRYADIRRTYDRDSLDDQKRAHRDATAFYVANREAMDAGAVVAWENIPLEEGEVSAIQHAINILVDDGEEVFASECQNQPRRPTPAVLSVAAAPLIARKTSGFKAGVVPEWASHVVFMVDVHENVHFYSVAAVGSDFRGTFVGYGAYPEQPAPWFTQRRAKRTLSGLYAADKLSAKEAIVRGLLDVTGLLCSRKWETPDGNVLPVSLGLIDTGHLPDLVATAIQRSDHKAVLMGSRGVGFGPADKPLSEYDFGPEKVRRYGPTRLSPRWYVPRETRGGVQVVRFDAGWFKQTLHTQLLVPPGGAGEWTLYGDRSTDHEHFADHLTSQEPEPTTAKGRTVDVWRLRPNREDHWLDTATGCLVAASVVGCRLGADHEPPPRKPSKKPRLGITYAED
jgi:hypothetical protein